MRVAAAVVDAAAGAAADAVGLVQAVDVELVAVAARVAGPAAKVREADAVEDATASRAIVKADGAKAAASWWRT